MAKITVYSSVWSSDPGIVNRSEYEGSIDVADLNPDRDLKNIVEDRNLRPLWQAYLYRRSRPQLRLCRPQPQNRTLTPKNLQKNSTPIFT